MTTSDERAVRMLAPIAVLYDAMLGQHGAAPKGVAWSGTEAQEKALKSLLPVLDDGAASRGGCSVNDLGCGYGLLFEWLKDHPALEGGQYYGYDISQSMIQTAVETHGLDPRARFVQSFQPLWPADYSFCSGAFNIILDYDEPIWRDYVRTGLSQLWHKTRRGMAFNLTSIRCTDRKKDIWYADPDEWLDFARKEFSPEATLDHDYAEHLFTIIARR